MSFYGLTLNEPEIGSTHLKAGTQAHWSIYRPIKWPIRWLSSRPPPSLSPPTKAVGSRERSRRLKVPSLRGPRRDPLTSSTRRREESAGGIHRLWDLLPFRRRPRRRYSPPLCREEGRRRLAFRGWLRIISERGALSPRAHAGPPN